MTTLVFTASRLYTKNTIVDSKIHVILNNACEMHVNKTKRTMTMAYRKMKIMPG